MTKKLLILIGVLILISTSICLCFGNDKDNNDSNGNKNEEVYIIVNNLNYTLKSDPHGEYTAQVTIFFENIGEEPIGGPINIIVECKYDGIIYSKDIIIYDKTLIPNIETSSSIEMDVDDQNPDPDSFTVTIMYKDQQVYTINYSYPK